MLGLLASAPVSAEAVVHIQANMGIIRIDAEIDTGVDQKTAWTVLTDYNRWAEFIPDLLVCRVISQPGEPIRLEQRGRIPQLPNLPLVMITEVEETPRQSLRFQRIAGNIKTLVGEWRIKGKKRVQPWPRRWRGGTRGLTRLDWLGEALPAHGGYRSRRNVHRLSYPVAGFWVEQSYQAVFGRVLLGVRSLTA